MTRVESTKPALIRHFHNFLVPRDLPFSMNLFAFHFLDFLYFRQRGFCIHLTAFEYLLLSYFQFSGPYTSLSYYVYFSSLPTCGMWKRVVTNVWNVEV